MKPFNPQKEKKKKKNRRNKSISSRLACCRFLHSTATCTLHLPHLGIYLYRARYECTNVPEIHLRPTCVSWILGEEETPQYPSGSGRPLALSSRNTISRNTFKCNFHVTSEIRRLYISFPRSCNTRFDAAIRIYLCIFDFSINRFLRLFGFFYLEIRP